MYFPYFRGKQNELLVVRENAELIANSSIIPIIEPVKKNSSTIVRAVRELVSKSGRCSIICNPVHGAFQNSEECFDFIGEVVNEIDSAENFITIGFILKSSYSVDTFSGLLARAVERFSSYRFDYIHYGFTDSAAAKSAIDQLDNSNSHIFIDGKVSKLYMKKFSDHETVLLRDGFTKRATNKEYPLLEHFSDLLATYEFEGVKHFGDFLIVPDEFSESGGPAHAVAIHLTYLDQDDDMYIKHYVSDTNDSPVNPGGKFLEALQKLIDDIGTNPLIYQSQAVEEYRRLHIKEHFPGLGYVKKLSMQHHIELVADFLGR